MKEKSTIVKTLGDVEVQRIDSEIGTYGLKSGLDRAISEVKDPLLKDLLKSFISVTTERLSDEDLDSLTELVWGPVYEKYTEE